MMSWGLAEADQATVAFRDLLRDAAGEEQARVDALLVLSRRTVFAATWPGQHEAVRTLTSPQGETAMPIFTGPDTLQQAASEFGWQNADGTLDFRELGAREALRQALAHGVHFLVVDLATPHMVEFARDELSPILKMQHSKRSGAEHHQVPDDPSAAFRDAVRKSSRPPSGGRGSFGGLAQRVSLPDLRIQPASPVPSLMPNSPPRDAWPDPAALPSFDLAAAFAAPEPDAHLRPPGASSIPNPLSAPPQKARASQQPSDAPPDFAAPVLPPVPQGQLAEPAERPGVPPATGGVDQPVTSKPSPEPSSVGTPAPTAGAAARDASMAGTTTTTSESGSGAGEISDAPGQKGAAGRPGATLSAAAKELTARMLGGKEQARTLATRMAGRLGSVLSNPEAGDGEPPEAGTDEHRRASPAPSASRAPSVSPRGPAPNEQAPSGEMDDETLDAIGEALRAYPEVEWACALRDEQGGAVVGLRIDPSFHNRADEIDTKTSGAAERHGVAITVELLRTPEQIREARQAGTVFFPGRRRAVRR